MSLSSRNVTAACLAVGVFAGIALWASPPAQAQGSLPYTDPAAIGVLGLCNQAGQSIDQGSIIEQPFVWTAVSSIPAPPPYNGAGRTATLFAYQPRPGVAPQDWSGALLTASSRYTNPDHPMAEATAGDDTLQDFLEAYPPRWNGLVELRLYLGAPEEPQYSLKYAATDIQVTGDTWTVVRGGKVACNSGRAISIEQLLLPSSDITPTTTTRPGAEKAGPAPTRAGPGPSGSLSAAADGASMHFTVSGAARGRSRWPIALAAMAAAVLGLGGVVALRRRRGPRTPGP